MHERLKLARKALHLTQEFVGNQMGMARTTIVAIESGKRDVSASELAAFAELPAMDQAEIINLMQFKKRYREQLND